MAMGTNVARDIKAEGEARVHFGHHVDHLHQYGPVAHWGRDIGAITFNTCDAPNHHRGPIAGISAVLEYVSATTSLLLPFPQRPTTDPRTFIDTLRVYDYEEHFSEILQAIEPDTCVWILDINVVGKWLQRKTYTVLWMTGGLGMGKTVLATYLIDSLMTKIYRAGDKGKSTVLYGICKAHENNTLGKLLCVVMHQFLEQFPAINATQRLLRLERQSKVKGRGVEQGSLWNASSVALWQTLGDAITDAGLKRVYLIIDGLDVLDSTEQVGLFRLLRSGPPNVSVLAMSQALEPVRIEVSKHLISQTYYEDYDLTLNENSTNRDVERVIDKQLDRLSNLRGYSAYMKKETSAFLKKRINGSFLPVKLTVAQLEQTGTDTAKQVLESLADGFPELEVRYQSLVSKIPSQAFPLCSQILMHVLYAFRPLTLAELAVFCGYKSSNFTRDARGQESVTHPDLLNDLRLIGPILKIRHEDKTVHFFDPSVKSFLEHLSRSRDTTVNFDVPSASVAHYQMGIRLVEVLISAASEDFPHDWADFRAAKIEEMFREIPLLQYTLEYWDDHIKSALDQSTDVQSSPETRSEPPDSYHTQLIHTLTRLAETLNEPQCASFLMYFTCYKRQKFALFFGTMTALQLFMQLGMVDRVSSMLVESQQSDMPVAALWKYHTAVVFCATNCDSLGVFQTVVDLLGTNIDASRWDMLLLHAANVGNAELIQFILQRRRFIPKEVAAAALEAAKFVGTSAIQAFTAGSHDLAVKDDSGLNVLHHMVLRATDRTISTEVVEKAIMCFKERGVGLNTRDARNNTILHHICWSNSLCTKSLLKLLLDNDCDPNIRNSAGALPLHYAARKASFESFEFLVSRTRTNITSLRPTGSELRPFSGSSGQQGLLPLSSSTTSLSTGSLDSGQAVGLSLNPFRSKGGLTPLHWAMSRPCATAFLQDIQVIHCLLSIGFSLTDTTREGRTPLSIAVDSPELVHVLSIVFYRLDGANHLALSLKNTLGTLSNAQCIDDLWIGLNLERYSADLLWKSESGELSQEDRCIHRAMILAFILRSGPIQSLMRQLWKFTEEELTNYVQKIQRGEKIDFEDPKNIEGRQWQLLARTCGRKNMDLPWDRGSGLSREIDAEECRYMFRALENVGVADNRPQASSAQPATSRKVIEQRSVQKTVHKFDKILMLEEWKVFLWDIMRVCMNPETTDALTFILCLRTLEGKFSMDHRETDMQRDSATKVETFRRFRKLVAGK
ncbi:hypothetical protein LTR17_021246 [Elasticomyces elasticus]|nr:hypothetical protein LTR17_021246 [Elasticomyces elasticus]